VQLSLTGRSGPLVVEIEYRVAQDNARAFHNVMQEVQLSRQRNGAYGWSIARDIADPNCGPSAITARPGSIICASATARTQSERALHQRAIDFHLGPTDPRPAHAGAAVRFGALEGRYARPRRQRGLAGGRAGGRQQHPDLAAAPASGTTARAVNPAGDAPGMLPTTRPQRRTGINVILGQSSGPAN
jgi:hypothetical protein